MPRSGESRTIIVTESTSGKNASQVLVLDSVDSFTVSNRSKVVKHPVEGMGFSLTDHAYNENTKIHMTGMISNATRTKEVDLLTARNRTVAYIKKLDEKVAAYELAAESATGGNVLEAQITAGIVRDKSDRIARDVRELHKYMGISNITQLSQVNNGSRSDESVSQALLQRIRNEHILCTIRHPLKGTFTKMALVDFQMPNVTGPQALFVNLTWEQQRVAEVKISQSQYSTVSVATKKINGKHQGKKKRKLTNREINIIESMYEGNISREALENHRDTK